MFKKAVLFMTLLLSTVLLLSACSGDTSNEPAENNETETTASSTTDTATLVAGLDADPPQLDPHFSTAAVDRQVFHSIYDKLIDIDENMNFVPQLAEKWEISDDKKTYIFHLQKGVQFHDGTPFNAEAVKFNFERMLDPNLGSTRASELSSIDHMEVVDDSTLKVFLKEPYAPFLSVLTDRAGMMVSPTAVKEKGDDFKNSPVGTGPFKFVERVKQDKIVLERNENYWDGKPTLEKVVFRPYADENVRVTNLLSGEVDIINKVPAKDIEKIKNDPNVTLDSTNGIGFQGMYLNNKKGIFTNQKLRNALDLVIDRDAIVKVALRDTAVPAGGAISPGSWAYDDSIEPKERDIEKAKELMKEAGYENGFEFTLTIPPLAVEKQLGQMIQSMAKEAGITVNIEIVEFGTMLDKMDSFDFDATRLGWSGRVDPDGNMFALLHTTGSINYGYSNPEMDKILEQAREETDQTVRKELYLKAAKLAQEESPFIFIYHEKDFKAYKNNVVDYKLFPDTMMRFHDVSKK